LSSVEFSIKKTICDLLFTWTLLTSPELEGTVFKLCICELRARRIKLYGLNAWLDKTIGKIPEKIIIGI